jgi:hypothetical protein
VLGIQWLRNLWLILWDFLELTLEFCYGAKTIMLKGLYVTRLVVIEVENFPRLARAEKKGLEIPLIEESGVPDFNVVEGCISNPLEEFKAVFEEPKGLPPNGSYDHQIVLKEGTSSYYQKGQIEKFFRKLMEFWESSEIVNSPFPSHVLLFSKVDGS